MINLFKMINVIYLDNTSENRVYLRSAGQYYFTFLKREYEKNVNFYMTNTTPALRNI